MIKFSLAIVTLVAAHAITRTMAVVMGLALALAKAVWE
jgi:hypothetical protein